MSGPRADDQRSDGAVLVRRPTARWQALGTSAVLRLDAVERGRRTEAQLAVAKAAVVSVLAAIDRACSRFRADSELARVNAAGGRAVAVSDLLLDALEIALRAAELTDGLVDPCLGRTLELVGYDRDFTLLDALSQPPHELDTTGVVHSTPAPASMPIVTARVRDDWHAVELDRDSATVRLPKGVALDLGATAKAWAADRAAAAAAAASGVGALVSLGGDISVSGEAPDAGWAVRVADDHRAPASAPGQTIAIAAGGLASSSVTVRRWLHNGRAMQHIIDPRTGTPACGRWRTASVAAADCTDANIASTASILLSHDAPSWIARAGLSARLVAHDGAVQLVGDWPCAAAAPAPTREAP